MYIPNPSHIQAQSIDELLDEHDRSELVRLRDDLQERIKHAGNDEHALLEFRLNLVKDAIDQTS